MSPFNYKWHRICGEAYRERRWAEKLVPKHYKKGGKREKKFTETLERLVEETRDFRSG